MKTGLTDYAALLTKLQEEKDNMADYYTNTRNLHFHTDEDSKSRITLLTKDNNKVEYGITDLAESQIASRLKIPMNYYKYMKENSPAMLNNNVNTWLQDIPEQRFVRTLYGKKNNEKSKLTEPLIPNEIRLTDKSPKSYDAYIINNRGPP